MSSYRRTDRSGARKTARVGTRYNSESRQIHRMIDRPCTRFSVQGQCQLLRNHGGECEFE